MSGGRNAAVLSSRAIVAMIAVASCGCSSWPWKSGGRDAERLTRVIHAENARLKDVVVQLRASNEDMAQRALDDAGRIARLEEENDQFRMSIAAYQSERERMARSFQSLQEQVRLALGDRADVLTTSFSSEGSQGTRTPVAPASGDSTPPEGRIDSTGDALEIPLEDWFVPGSAILREGVEPRLARLARWLSTRIDANRGLVSDPGVLAPEQFAGSDASVGTSPERESESRENLLAIEALRARRLWDAVSQHLPAETGSKIRFGEGRRSPVSADRDGRSSRLIVPLESDS